MDKTPYIYLFIREDLSPAQKIVQAAHAVEQLNIRHPQSKINHMVLLSAKHEEDLLKTAFTLEGLGIKHEMFYEPDISAYTAIATKPLIGNERRPLKKYKLYK